MTLIACCLSTVLWCGLILWFGTRQNSLELVFPGSSVWSIWRRSFVSFFVLSLASPFLILFTMLLTEPIICLGHFSYSILKAVVIQEAQESGELPAAAPFGAND